MLPPPGAHGRCGIDTVDIVRIERLLKDTPVEQLAEVFSDAELRDAGGGPGRAARLAARFAAKEACLKLFPRETALARIDVADFAVARDNYGAPLVVASRRAAIVLGRHRVARIHLSLTHNRRSATAIAITEPQVTEVPRAGRLLYRFLPYRRTVILDNLRRAYGGRVSEVEIERLAQAHYGPLWQ